MIGNLSLCGMPRVCKCVIGFLLCTGLNITHFPDFTTEDKFKTIHIDLSDNQLTKPPINSTLSWPVLNSIDLRHNKAIPCDQIRKFIIGNPNIIIYHECERTDFLSDIHSTFNKFSSTEFLGNLPRNLTTSGKHNHGDTTSGKLHNGDTTSPNLYDKDHKEFKDWQTGAILLLSEAVLLAVGIIFFAVYKAIAKLRVSLLQSLSIPPTHDQQQQESGQPMLVRRPTQEHLPDITDQSIV